MTATAWKAGAASTVITPSEPMWLAGWAARREPAAAVAMDLFAKALALEDPRGERVVIVTADLIAIPAALCRAVAARVDRQWRLPRARLLFNASHTHTGPEVRPDKVPFFDIPSAFAAKIEPYVAALETKLADVVDRALRQLKPATLRVQEARVDFAHNRRSPTGPVDHGVPVLSAHRTDGAPLAIAFGYACHNLTLPPSFCAYHGDYAGVAQAALEQASPGVTALFLAGAGADQDPSPRGQPELVETHGNALARAITVGRGAVVTGSLSVAYEDVALDLLPLPPPGSLQADIRSEDAPRRRKAEFLLAALAAGRPLATTQACPVQVIRLGGQLLLVALAGEPVIDFARRFRNEFAGPLVWTAGYSNDMFGYLPTRAVQQEGGYEAGRAALWSAIPMPVAESSEERVIEAARRLAGALNR